jgi:trans-aconitate 2-methyltransferase
MAGADWKAETYHRISAPQRAWGEQVLARLELAGDETALDAGCGTGRLTRRLAERLPRGRVVALDASPAMLEVAQRELRDLGDRISFVRADLGRDPLPEGMDLVFSTAAFHWVHDQDALYAGIARALVPGGRLHAQCGGAGNLARAHSRIVEIGQREPFASHFAGMTEPWVFATPKETEARLVRSGFEVTSVALEDAPTPFPDAASYSEFVGSVVLRPFLAQLPVELHTELVAELTARAEHDTPPLSLDYVRLNMQARKRQAK